MLPVRIHKSIEYDNFSLGLVSDNCHCVFSLIRYCPLIMYKTASATVTQAFCEKMYLKKFANCTWPDQTAHEHSLIMAWAVALRNN